MSSILFYCLLLSSIVFDIILYIILDVCVCADDGVLLGQWGDVAVSSTRGEGLSTATIVFSDAMAEREAQQSPADESSGYGGEEEEEDDAASPTSLHVLITICLWSTSLCVAIGFDDVSIALTLSGGCRAIDNKYTCIHIVHIVHCNLPLLCCIYSFVQLFNCRYCGCFYLGIHPSCWHLSQDTRRESEEKAGRMGNLSTSFSVV